MQEAMISAVSSDKFKDFLLYLQQSGCFVVYLVARVQAGLQLVDLEVVCTSRDMNDLQAHLGYFFQRHMFRGYIFFKFFFDADKSIGRRVFLSKLNMTLWLVHSFTLC